MRAAPAIAGRWRNRLPGLQGLGKGGQHVNTTDSAVHALHVPSGISVKVMSERSQHANKRLARELLALKLARLNAQGEGQARRSRSQQHWAVERGSPVKVFRA